MRQLGVFLFIVLVCASAGSSIAHRSWPSPTFSDLRHFGSPQGRRLASEPGAACAASSNCSSGVCAGSFCCPANVRPGTCRECIETNTTAGNLAGCDACNSGYTRFLSTCYDMGPWSNLPSGHACIRGSQCGSGSCRERCCAAGVDADLCGECDESGQCSRCSWGCNDCKNYGTTNITCAECGWLYVRQGSQCAPFVAGSAMVTTSWVTSLTIAVLLVVGAMVCLVPPSATAATAAVSRGKALAMLLWSFRGVVLATLDVITDAAAMLLYFMQKSAFTGMVAGVFLAGAVGGQMMFLARGSSAAAAKAKAKGKGRGSGIALQPISHKVAAAGTGARSPTAAAAGAANQNKSVVAVRVEVSASPAAGLQAGPMSPTSTASAGSASPAAAAPIDEEGVKLRPRVKNLAVKCMCWAIMLWFITGIILALQGLIHMYMVISLPLALGCLIALLMPAAMATQACRGHLFAIAKGTAPPKPAKARWEWLPMVKRDTAAVLEAVLEAVPQGLVSLGVLVTASLADALPVTQSPIKLSLAVSTLTASLSMRGLVFVCRNWLLFAGLSLLASCDVALLFATTSIAWPPVTDFLNGITSLGQLPFVAQLVLVRTLAAWLAVAAGIAVYRRDPHASACTNLLSGLGTWLLATICLAMVLPYLYILGSVCWLVPALAISARMSRPKDQKHHVLGMDARRLVFKVPLPAMAVLVVVQLGTSGWLPFAVAAESSLAQVLTGIYAVQLGLGVVITAVALAWKREGK